MFQILCGVGKCFESSFARSDVGCGCSYLCVIFSVSRGTVDSLLAAFCHLDMVEPYLTEIFPSFPIIGFITDNQNPVSFMQYICLCV
jgi:hypothetical protein